MPVPVDAEVGGVAEVVEVVSPTPQLRWIIDAGTGEKKLQQAFSVGPEDRMDKPSPGDFRLEWYDVPTEADESKVPDTDPIPLTELPQKV
jgi:hypothetical protein